CTREYKMDPVRRAIRRLVLGVSPRAKLPPGMIELWMGISQDEIGRTKKSDVGYIIHRYPLVQDLQSSSVRRLFPVGYTRSDCLHWLEQNGYPRPPKSACIGCPYHDDAGWLAIKSNPNEWADACGFDAAIRTLGGPRGNLYLHKSCMPLSEVVFDPDEATHVDGIAVRGMVDECEGMCGV